MLSLLLCEFQVCINVCSITYDSIFFICSLDKTVHQRLHQTWINNDGYSVSLGNMFAHCDIVWNVTSLKKIHWH